MLRQNVKIERIIREVEHPGNLIQGRIMTGTTK